ncbi:hypothetical protein B005_3194 [Nocardiopsis alba ATCC BAA-2165]|uniref:Uncharacterized protein n=1 Tax=Nocardiopsis alba (strain ATCC BAA-2165 / BE74) TaxID=1205910 RepID=J7LCK2_NOCAA|nr:hypothetical protein B005_3194 [Nocardiopsis alba ATCC BAA-2165]
MLIRHSGFRVPYSGGPIMRSTGSGGQSVESAESPRLCPRLRSPLLLG